MEPRNAGGSYTIVLHFDRPLQSGNTVVTCGGGVGSVSFNGSDMLVNLNGVGDQQRLTVTANNIAAVGGGVLSTASVGLGVLIGDSNGDGTVNSADAQQTRNRSGQTADASNFRSDVNRDGTVNSGDATVIRARSGNALP